MSKTATRTRRSITSLAAAAVMAAIGAGCSGSDDGRSSPPASPLDSIVPSALSEVPDFEASVEPAGISLAAPANEPIEAVRNYLAGEINGMFDQSYAALSSESRQDVDSIADWTETAFTRPTIIDFELDPDAAGSPAGTTTVIVPGEVTLEPRLDEVSGFVPQQADVEWTVVAEDGGWRLDLDGFVARPDPARRAGRHRSGRALGRRPSTMPRRRRVRGLAARVTRTRRPAVRRPGRTRRRRAGATRRRLGDGGRRRLRSRCPEVGAQRVDLRCRRSSRS